MRKIGTNRRKRTGTKKCRSGKSRIGIGRDEWEEVNQKKERNG